MKIQRVAAFVAMLLVAGPALAQGQGNGNGRGQERGAQGFERERDFGRGEARPDEARRERRGRAGERIRERRERRGGDAGERGRNDGGDIYRRSNNYRRW